jgi:hypothetical protein
MTIDRTGKEDSGQPATPETADSAAKRPYEKPVLRNHGTVAGLTRAYLQGGKTPGTRDAAESGVGRDRVPDERDPGIITPI